MSFEEMEQAIIKVQTAVEVFVYIAGSCTFLFMVILTLVSHIWVTTQKRQKEKDATQDETLKAVGKTLEGIKLLLASHGITIK